MRKALYIALEMQKSLDDIYFGTWKRTLSYLHPTHWAYNNQLKDETPNPELAAKMLDEAGWRIGADGIREKNGVKLQFTMSTTAGNQTRAGLSGALPAELEEDRRRDGDQEHAGLGGLGRVHHQDAIRHAAGRLGTDGRHGPRLYGARHSKMIPVKDGAGSNYVQYQNPEVDQPARARRHETEQAERKETYAKSSRSCSTRCRSPRKAATSRAIAEEEGR